MSNIRISLLMIFGIIHIIVLLFLLLNIKKVVKKLKKVLLIERIIVMGLYITSIIILFTPVPFISFALLAFSAIFLIFPFSSSPPSIEKVDSITYKETSLKDLLLKHKLKGSGISSDPFIIDTLKYFPIRQNINLKNSKLFIEFRSCEFYTIKLKKNSNLLFKKCRFESLIIKECVNIELKNCIFKNISIRKSVHINIEDSIINWLKLTYSFLNSIKNTSIQKIAKTHSPDNIIDIIDLFEKEKESRFPNFSHLIMVSFIFSFIIITILYFSILLSNLNFNVIFSSLMSLGYSVSFLIIFLLEAIKLRKKVNKFYSKKKKIIPNFVEIIVGYLLIILCIIVIDIILTIEIINPDIWINNLYRISILLFFLFFGPFLVLVSVNFLIYKNWISQEVRNPFYPYYIPTISYLFPFWLLVVFYKSLEILGDIIFLVILFTIIIYLIFLMNSYITNVNYKKLVKNSQNNVLITQNTFKIIISALSIATSLSFLFILTNILPKNLVYGEILFFIFLIIILGTVFFIFGKNIFPSSSSVFEGLSATSYYKNGDYKKALDKFTEMLEKDPKNSVLWNNLATTYFSMEKYNKAINAYKKALELKKDSKASLTGLGIAYIKIEDYDAAIQTLKEALDAVKKPSIAIKMGDIFKQSFETSLQEEMIWANIGYAYAMKDDFINAKKFCYRALNLNPNIKEAFTTLAYIYNKKGEYDKAIEISENALKIDTKYPYAFIHLGRSYHLKGDLHQAIQMFKQAVQIKPNFHEAWYRLAEIYLDLGQNKNALEACNTSLQYNPEYEEALKLRIKILNSVGK